jgi:hypothetical protein
MYPFSMPLQRLPNIADSARGFCASPRWLLFLQSTVALFFSFRTTAASPRYRYCFDHPLPLAAPMFC